RHDTRRHRTCLYESFLDYQTDLGIEIVKQLFAVHRLIELALGRLDDDLAEQGVQAKRARFVGDDRDNASADIFVPQQMAQQADKSHGGGRLDSRGAFKKFAKTRKRWRLERFGFDLAPGQVTTQRFAPLEQVLRFRTVGGRTVKRRIDNLLVADRDVEPGAKLSQLLLVQLL